VPPNHLDFLAVLDRHTRESPPGKVISGNEMHSIAADAGLVEPGDSAAARRTGELVGLGYVYALSRSPGVGEVPVGVGWSDREL
jgi:hypothetical protein